MKKRILACLLTAAMVFTSADFTVFATETVETVETEAVAKNNEESAEQEGAMDESSVVVGEETEAERIVESESERKKTEQKAEESVEEVVTKLEENSEFETKMDENVTQSEQESIEKTEEIKSDIESETENLESIKESEEVTEETCTESETQPIVETETSNNGEDSVSEEVSADTVEYAVTGGEFTYTVSGTEATITGYSGSGGSVTIPEIIGEYTVTEIGSRAFYNCTSLTNVELPDSVKVIEIYAFYGCKNMSMIELSSNLEEIGGSAFENCTKITEINIPKTIKSIGSDAFENCTGLTTVKFNYNDIEGYTCNIGDCAFYGCTSLTDVKLSENIVRIGDEIFENCNALTELILPKSLTSMGHMIIRWTAISNIIIPKNIKQCDYYVYNGYSGPLADCETLKTVIFEEGMTTIPSYILANGNDYTSYVTKVVIPATVTSIGSYAFYNCNDITIYGYKNSYAETYAKENDIPFKGYDLYTDDIISESYGVIKNQKTRVGNVYVESYKFTQAANDYYKTVKNRFQKDCKELSAKPSTFKQLRAWDETAEDRKTNQLLTIDSSAPTEAVDDAYEVLYEFLQECMQTGVKEKLIKIDTSESVVEIEAKIVNKIFDAIQEENESFTGRGSNGYTVRLVKTGFWGQSFGSVTISGGKKYYTRYIGTFCSNSKVVSAALTQFVDDLSDEVRNLYKEAALSLWKDFAKKSELSSITEDMLNEYLEDKADYLIQKGYGKLLTTIVNVKKCQDLVSEIASTQNATDALAEIQSGDMEALYKNITKLSYTDKELKNETVKIAMEKVEKRRKQLEDALYDYLYNDDTYDDMSFGEKFTHFWKSTFQCPVDIQVYDESDKLIGSVIDGVVFYDESIYIELDGDVKIVYIPKDMKVYYKLEGTNEGNMNYVLEEYEDGIPVGRLNYYEVPLTDGIKYEQELEASELPEDISSIPLTQEDGTVINASELITADDKEANVTIEGITEGSGTIVGTGKYAKGDSVELIAMADDGYQFAGWYESEILMDLNPNYRFTAIENQTITAKFDKSPIILSDYTIELSDDYKDSARVVFYENSEDTADIVISLYDSESTENLDITIIKYDKDKNEISRETVEAVCDGDFHFIVTEFPINGWEGLAILDNQGNEIGAFGTGIGANVFVITATAEEHGTITPSGEVSVKKDESVTFTIDADEGYDVDEVFVDNCSIGAVYTYTFEKVSETHTISVIFKPVQSTETEESTETETESNEEESTEPESSEPESSEPESSEPESSEPESSEPESSEPESSEPELSEPESSEPESSEPESSEPESSEPESSEPESTEPETEESTESETDDDSQSDIPKEDIPAGGIPNGLWIAGIDEAGYIYTGTAVKPEVRVYDNNKRLISGKDYTISYKNNKKACILTNSKTAPTIIVKGKGDYAGTETATFKINPINLNDTNIDVSDITVSFNNKMQKKIPTVTYNGKKLSGKKDFSVSYTDNSANAYKAIGSYNLVLTGKGNFTGTRTIKLVVTDNILISKASVSKVSNYEYTGQPIEPPITVSINKAPLTLGSDYTVSYKNNTEIGTATVIVTGIGKYAGTKKLTFKILGEDLKKAQISGIENKVYNGQNQEQTFTVWLNGKKLIQDADYNVTYTNNVNAGKVMVTITGINAYSGTVKKSFKITPYDLNADTDKKLKGLESNIQSKYVKGGSQPKPVLTFDGKVLVEGNDYTISYKNNKAVSAIQTGKAPLITIKGKGNFKGTITKSFTISAKELNDADSPVTIHVPDMAFVDKAGKYISKPVLIDADGKKLVAGKDYDKSITYTLENGTILTKNDKVQLGTNIKVTVKGIGAYSGTLEAVYQITKSDFSKAKIKISAQSYTGKEILLDSKDISVTIGGTPLTYGTDYEILHGSYINNIQRGTASVIIIGKGNYGGSKTVKFKIVPKQLSWFWKMFG